MCIVGQQTLNMYHSICFKKKIKLFFLIFKPYKSKNWSFWGQIQKQCLNAAFFWRFLSTLTTEWGRRTWTRRAASCRRRCSAGWPPGAAAGSAGTAGGRGPAWASLGRAPLRPWRAPGARWCFSWRASCTRRESPRCPPCTPPWVCGRAPSSPCEEDGRVHSQSVMSEWRGFFSGRECWGDSVSFGQRSCFSFTHLLLWLSGSVLLFTFQTFHKKMTNYVFPTDMQCLQIIYIVHSIFTAKQLWNIIPRQSGKPRVWDCHTGKCFDIRGQQNQTLDRFVSVFNDNIQK